MMTSTALDLEFLTEAERDLILSVIRKDEELHGRDQIRINNLKAEIKALKVKGALKPGMDAEKSCARCRETFGWIFDRGELCPKCKQKVCENCQCIIKNSDKWICILCNKQKDLDTMSGAWFFSQFRKSKRNKNNSQVVSGTEIVKNSFRKKNTHAKMNGTQRTTEDVRRALAKGSREQTSSPDHEGESSDTQSMEAHSPRRHKKSDLYNAQFPKDSEKIMLLDLLGGPSVAPIQYQVKSPEPLQPTVHVQHISSRRYSVSSSDGSDGMSAPSSPQLSHRTESEYAPSESINSSFRSTSAVSSDGRCTMVTDNVSVISGISTAPPSMQESPILNSRESTSHNTNSRESHFNIKLPSNKHSNPYDSGINSSVVSTSCIDKDRDDRTSSDSVSEHYMQYQHLSKSSSDDVQRVQTVKVVSRGRSASVSSSSDDDQFMRSNNNNIKPYQSNELKSANQEYPNSQVPIERSWNRSSGSDSSRTTKGRKDNSDGLSQGSESCAETGSTIDASVLDPPSEFTTDDQNDVENNMEETYLITNGNQGEINYSVNGIEKSISSGENLSQKDTGLNLASMKDKINDLLTKYNINVNNGDSVQTNPSTTYKINQSVHTIAPVIVDDFEVIDTPPMSKKPRLNLIDSNINFESSSSSFEDIDSDTPHQSEPSIEELEWDSALSGMSSSSQTKHLSNLATFNKVNVTDSIYQSKPSDIQTTVKLHTKDYSSREDEFLSDKTVRYPKTDDRPLVIPSHLLYQIDDLPSRESDEYSDSLSVITERTEPEDDDIDSDNFDTFDKNDLTVILENESHSEEEDFDTMFQANLELLGEQNTNIVFVKKLSDVSNQDILKSQQSNNIVSIYEDCNKESLLKDTEPNINQRHDTMEKPVNISVDGKEQGNDKNLPSNKNTATKDKLVSILDRRDTLSMLADEELERAPLEAKRISIDLSQVADNNILFLNEDDKKELKLSASSKNQHMTTLTENSKSAKLLNTEDKNEPIKISSDRSNRSKYEKIREDSIDTLVNQELLNSLITEKKVKPSLQRDDTIDVMVKEELELCQTVQPVNKGLKKQDTISFLAEVELSNSESADNSNHLTQKDSLSSSKLKITKSTDSDNSCIDDSHISPVASLKKQFDSNSLSSISTYEPIQKPHAVDERSMKQEKCQSEQEMEVMSEQVISIENLSQEIISESDKSELSDTEDYFMTEADFEDLGELLASEIIECAVYGCKEMIMLHSQESFSNYRIDVISNNVHPTKVKSVHYDESSKPQDEESTSEFFFGKYGNLETLEVSGDCNLEEDSNSHKIVVQMVEFENIQSPSERFQCEKIGNSENHFFSDESNKDSITEVQSVQVYDESGGNDVTSSGKKQGYNEDVLLVAAAVVDGAMQTVKEYFSSNDKNMIVDSNHKSDNSSTNKIDGIDDKFDLLKSVLDEVHSSHLLRKPNKSPVISRAVMHPAFQKSSLGRTRPSSTGSTDSSSFLSDSEQIYQGIRSSTPTRNSSGYLVHPSSTSLSPTGTPYGSLGRQTAKRHDNELERDYNEPSHYKSIADSDVKSDIHSDFKSDEQQSIKSEGQMSAKSDVHNAKTDVQSLKSEGKTDSGFVKQDSISSALSVPSLCVTDTSPNDNNNKEEEEEAEDDIDDLVSSFKTNKALSKSQGQLHNPRQTNLMSSFSSSVESVTSIYSEAGEGNYGNIPVEGEIQFGIDYKYKSSTFEINVKQCKGIAAVDTKRKRSDPYVKTYLLPDRTKSGKRKSRVRKHTLNPIFNEVLKYHISKSELESRTLWVTVWNNDTFGKNDFLGEVTVPLDYQEFKDTSPKWYQLQDRTPVQTSLLTYKGDLNIALKYVTADNVSSNRKVKGKIGNKGELQVLLKQARNLTAVRSSGTSDPFCKGYLLPEKTKGVKQKTHVIKKNCNPQWNHTFVFEDVGFEELKERSLELTIWDHDRFTSNDFLGGVRLGLGTGKCSGKEVDWSDSKGEEISVWQSMLDRPNYWIEQTLLLRPNMNSRKAAV